MAGEAQHCATAGRFLLELRVRTGSVGVSSVRAFLASKVDLDIAAVTVEAGHMGGLGLNCFLHFSMGVGFGRVGCCRIVFVRS